MWSGCLLAAKSIALETMSGKVSAESRRTNFLAIDMVSAQDPVFRAGVELAPAFKKMMHQEYSLDGVPPESPVRRYL